MPNQTIGQLPSFASDSNIRANDLLVAERGGVTGKVVFSGQRVLPLADNSKANFALRVASDGTPEWRSETAAAQSRVLLWSGTRYGAPLDTGALTALVSGRRFEDYAMISMVVLLRNPSGGEGLDRWTTQTVARSQWNGYFNATAFHSFDNVTMYVSRHDNTRFQVNVSYPPLAPGATIDLNDMPRLSWIYGHNNIG